MKTFTKKVNHELVHLYIWCKCVFSYSKTQFLDILTVLKWMWLLRKADGYKAYQMNMKRVTLL